MRKRVVYPLGFCGNSSCEAERIDVRALADHAKVHDELVAYDARMYVGRRHDMTLWTKPIDQITYADVVDFCDNKLPEGTNLDYKADVPTKLPKTVASLANTTGGLVVIGVTTDQSNKPDQIVGVDIERGFSERVAQICRDNINPPFLPEISPLIPLPSDSTKAVAVLRVAQSPSAPHAINNNVHVYVRRNDVTDCIDLADVTRIGHLLSRRQQLECIPDANIALNLERMERHMVTQTHPVVWWHVGPLYPWQDICPQQECTLADLGFDLRRAPDGAIGFGHIDDIPGQRRPTAFTSVHRSGMFFQGQAFFQSSSAARQLDAGVIGMRSFEFFSNVRRFYEARRNAYPGVMSLVIGFEHVALQQMIGLRGGGGKFPDASFRAKQLMEYTEFIKGDFSPQNFWKSPMMTDVAHAFGHPT